LWVEGTAATSIHDNQIFNNSAPGQAATGAYIYCILTGLVHQASSLVIFNNSIHDQSIISSNTSSDQPQYILIHHPPTRL
jgi:hypothetical protein